MREHLDVAQQRQVIPVFFFRERDGGAQYVRLETNVGVREHQPLAGGMLESLLQAMRFAQPPRGKGSYVHHFQVGISAGRRV